MLCYTHFQSTHAKPEAPEAPIRTGVGAGRLAQTIPEKKVPALNLASPSPQVATPATTMTPRMVTGHALLELQALLDRERREHQATQLVHACTHTHTQTQHAHTPRMHSTPARPPAMHATYAGMPCMLVTSTSRACMSRTRVMSHAHISFPRIMHTQMHEATAVMSARRAMPNHAREMIGRRLWCWRARSAQLTR